MSLTDAILQEFEMESATTRRVLAPNETANTEIMVSYEEVT